MDSKSQSAEWCRRVQLGDHDAASSLLREHYASVFAYLRRRTGNDDDAADLTQDTFQKVWTCIAGFRAESSVGTWIHRIAHGTWVDWVRSASSTRERNHLWWQTLPLDFPSPVNEMQTQELLQHLWQFVEELPNEEANAVHLRYGQQLTLKDTAAVMEIPLSTLKVRLRSALDSLRRRLESHDVCPNVPTIQ